MSTSHKVQQGDCISSIALNYGHFWETVWNDAANTELKKLRKDPNILLPDDIVAVASVQLRHEKIATDKCHRFRRKGVPAMLKLRFLEEPESEVGITDNEDETVAAQGLNSVTEESEQADSPELEPRSNAPYSIDIDGRLTSGQLDSDGYLEKSIPPNAQKAKIIIDAGTLEETSLEINLGHLDPITEILGIKQRLANLAYECGDRTTEETDGFVEAITSFQENCNLEVNGELTEEVRDKVLQLHGS